MSQDKKTDKVKQSIGSQITAKRLGMNFTRNDVHEATGVAPRIQGNIEKGVTNYAINSLLAVCAELKIKTLRTEL